MTRHQKETVRDTLRLALNFYLKDQFITRDHKSFTLKGICLCLTLMYDEGLIELDAYVWAKMYVEKHKPVGWYRLLTVLLSGVSGEGWLTNYYYSLGSIAPRIKYLKKHIEKLSA